MLRRLTLSLLHAHPAKLSIAKKRFAAALDPSFLEEILRGDGILEKAGRVGPASGRFRLIPSSTTRWRGREEGFQ